VKSIPALELRNVSYVQDGKPILQSIDWIVQPGEHWAILGPNGGGKTTLLKLACGYLWPNAGGEIYRNGKTLANLPELRKSIGWVTANLTAQIPEREIVIRTVVSGKFAQIGYLERFGGRATPRDYRMAQKFLDEMRCGQLGKREFGTLSQGEQQKVLVARARMTRPYLIFLDEPCAGMDPGARENFLATLGLLGKRRNIPALIFVTHHIEEILPLFKRALVLSGGKMLHAGATDQVLKPGILRELYGVSFTLTRRKGRYWPVLA
jgi:iron complex transport system ATP-binding protein